MSIKWRGMSRRQLGESLFLTDLRMVRRMTREEIEKRMDEIARKYVETHDPEIIEELYKLRLELNRLEKESSD
jgi:hypothetical protein